MVKYWGKKPKERPTFSDLVRGFEQVLVKEMDYYNEAIFLSGEPESVWKNTKTKQELHTKIHEIAIFESLSRKKIRLWTIDKRISVYKVCHKKLLPIYKIGPICSDE